MSRKAAIARSLGFSAALFAFACGGPTVEPEPSVSTPDSARASTPKSGSGASASGASSRPSASSGLLSGAPSALLSGAPSALPSSAPADGPNDPEAIERENAGCKFRKSTNRLSACAKQGNNLGSWVPSDAEFAQAATLSRGACYCVTGLDALAKTCMQQLKSPLVTFTVGTLGDATDCTVTISSAESKGRRFLRFHAANRDVATFYSTISIYERTGGAFASYFVGFNGVEIGAEQGVSPEMRREWHGLPAELRNWMEN